MKAYDSGVYSYLRWNNRSEVSHRTQTNEPIKLATMSFYRADVNLTFWVNFLVQLNISYKFTHAHILKV